jgi:hypothetical protein
MQWPDRDISISMIFNLYGCTYECIIGFFSVYIYGGALYRTLSFSAIGSFADNPPSDGQHQGVNVIKHFSSSPMLRQNKL